MIVNARIKDNEALQSLGNNHKFALEIYRLSLQQFSSYL